MSLETKNKNTNRVINALYSQLKKLQKIEHCDRFLKDNKILLSLQGNYNQYICNAVHHIQWMMIQQIQEIRTIQKLPLNKYIDWSKSLNPILLYE